MKNWIDRFTPKRGRQARQPALVTDSPLRQVDPRAKLAMSLAASALVMLPAAPLGAFLLGYGLLLAWAKLFPVVLRQVWRIRWILLILFGLDWWLVDLNLAILVSFRLILLVGTFSFLVATTTFGEFRLAIERLGIPYRIAFSLGLAFQSIDLLGEEWQAIREAQQARGIRLAGGGWRKIIHHIGDWVGLTIPAVVLTTRRAWAVTESAYARGFDAPKRQAYQQLTMAPVDWVITLVSCALPWFLYWRWG